MLSKSLRFVHKSAVKVPAYHFGGGGARYVKLPVHLDNSQPYLGNHSFDKDMVCLNGWNDVNDHHHHDHADPYAHLRNAPLFSFTRMYFADPGYVPDDQEALMNEPHGYLTGDDPLDTRHNYERPALEVWIYFTFAFTLALGLGYNYLINISPAVSMFNLNLAADLLEDEMRKIRIENKALEDRRDQLRSELGL